VVGACAVGAGVIVPVSLPRPCAMVRLKDRSFVGSGAIHLVTPRLGRRLAAAGDEVGQAVSGWREHWLSVADRRRRVEARGLQVMDSANLDTQ
jgi:hypothetical protein